MTKIYNPYTDPIYTKYRDQKYALHTDPKYTLYTDSKYAWLKVPKVELMELDIADEISTHSKVLGDDVYLEACWDGTLFTDAKQEQDPYWNMLDHVNEDSFKRTSKIRGFDIYVARHPAKNVNVKRKKTYTWYWDSENMLLEVSKAELAELDIAYKISEHSYMRKDYAYLEMWTDVTLFENAKREENPFWNYTDCTRESLSSKFTVDIRSRIKDCERYSREESKGIA